VPEQIVSRVLFSLPVTRKGVMIINLEQQLPVASSDTTRELRAGYSQTFSYLVLLQMGFTKLPRSPGKLVSSYLTFSPLPGVMDRASLTGRYIFCGTFLRVTPSRR